MGKQLVSERLQWIVVIIVMVVLLMYDIDKGMRVGLPFNFSISNFRFTLNWIPRSILIMLFFTFFMLMRRRS